MTKKSISKALPGIFTLFTIIGAILFRSCRQHWIFVTTTVGFNLPIIVISLMITFSVLLGILYVLRLSGNKFCEKKAYKALLIIGGIFSVFLLIFGLAYSIGCSIGEGREVFIGYFAQTLSESALLIAIPFFTLIFPKYSSKFKKAITCLSLVAVILFGINAHCPLTAYKITSEPMVIDNGEEYSIVFSTNDEGSAYVEYTYNGKDYKVYDNVGGRLTAGRIHSISVPYEHLRGNTYKVSSTRVMEDFSYGSRRGSTVTSDEYEFTYNETDNQTWLVISDWHTMLDDAYAAIGNLQSDYDAVILLGDASPGVDFEQQVISNIVEFGGKVSGGNKPVLYARGNHETRGSYADDLAVSLGIDEFYYTSDIGPYSFVILDSGEDKVDSHVEYGGMTDYETYRADMIQWLKGVEVKNEKVIALSHAWQISTVENDLSLAGWAELDRLGTRLIISGHEHSCRILGERDGYEKQIKEAYPHIIGYLDGGKTSGNYVASLMKLSESGFELKAVDKEGSVILSESFDW